MTLADFYYIALVTNNTVAAGIARDMMEEDFGSTETIKASHAIEAARQLLEEAR